MKINFFKGDTRVRFVLFGVDQSVFYAYLKSRALLRDCYW